MPDASRDGGTDSCELCEAAPLTTRYHEDSVCWVADCDTCGVPMVVWSSHGAEPPDREVSHMLRELEEAAIARFGAGGFTIDRHMRQIPGHFHAHARDPLWWHRLFGGPGGLAGR